MGITRRRFLYTAGLSAAPFSRNLTGNALPAGLFLPVGHQSGASGGAADETAECAVQKDRKIRMGIAGYGYSRFGAAFSFQDHPNVEVAAVTDLIPDRCVELARRCRCDKTYPSLEKMIEDDSIEAVFLATDAPSHARHSIASLEKGKHVASAVPAVFGSLEEADRLFTAVKKSGLNYMMMETSAFRDNLYAMRKLYESGDLGRIVYCEGEYYHYMPEPLGSFRGWRVGLPPMWYPTHSTAYFTGVTGGGFTEVSCMGMPASIGHLTPSGNSCGNPFGTEIGLFRMDNGAMARMAVSWDTPGHEGETGRIRASKGSFSREFDGLDKGIPAVAKPPLPPGVEPGGHGGSHGYLAHEFVMSIIEKRKPLVDVTWALNMTAAGIAAHQSALRDGELTIIPSFS